MRALLVTLLIALPCLVAVSDAEGDRPGIPGTWTWTYPQGTVPPTVYPITLGGVRQQEPGTLALGPASGQWTIELPSALVGCDGGRPSYTPRAGQTALVQTFPDGACRLYVMSSGHYAPVWSSGRDAFGGQANLMRGEGDFH